MEALEGQNRELQADLRVMEGERLVWWQQQVRLTAGDDSTTLLDFSLVCSWNRRNTPPLPLHYSLHPKLSWLKDHHF